MSQMRQPQSDQESLDKLLGGAKVPNRQLKNGQNAECKLLYKCYNMLYIIIRK